MYTNICTCFRQQFLSRHGQHGVCAISRTRHKLKCNLNAVIKLYEMEMQPSENAAVCVCDDVGVGAAPQVSALVRDFKGAEAKTVGRGKGGWGSSQTRLVSFSGCLALSGAC